MLKLKKLKRFYIANSKVCVYLSSCNKKTTGRFPEFV